MISVLRTPPANLSPRSFMRRMAHALLLLACWGLHPVLVQAQCASHLPTSGTGVGYSGAPLGSGDAIVKVAPPLTPNCLAYGLCTSLSTNGFTVAQDSCPVNFAPGQHWEFLWESPDRRTVKYTTDERPSIPQCGLYWPRPTLTLTIPPTSPYQWIHNVNTGLVSVILDVDTLVFTVRETDDSSATANHANTVLNGCIDTSWVTCSSLTFGFFQEPRPSITQVGNELVAPYGTAHQWLLNGTAIPGATDTTYFPPAPGLYSVLVTFNGNCTLESDSIQFEFVAAAEPVAPMGKVRVSPNPFSETFALTIEQTGRQAVSLTVRDCTGNTVWARQRMAMQEKFEMEIDLGDLPPGIYFLEIASKGTQSIHKLLKINE